MSSTIVTSRRWLILFLLFLAITINILDRQVLSLVAPELRDKFGMSNTQYGTILFFFLLGMTIGQIPMGLLMDRKGPRFGFTVSVCWWSLASLLHAFARSAAQFSLFRFILGLGECGTYSGGVKVIGRWFPAEERALAGGLFNSGSLAGAILAPPLIVWLTTHYGWQSAFALPSLAGLVWLVPWLLIYRDPPGFDNRVSAPAVPFASLLAVPAVWGVILMRAFGGPVTHFYWYWLPEYLKRERGMSLEMIGWLAWMPFFAGGAGNIGGGWFSSWLVRRGWGIDRARKTAFYAATALSLSAVFVPMAPTAGSALALICVATLGINAFSANLIGLLTDLFPQGILARVTALTGVGDGIASMLMMQLTGIVVDRFSYLPVFAAAGLLPVLALTALLVLVRRIRPYFTDNNAAGLA